MRQLLIERANSQRGSNGQTSLWIPRSKLPTIGPHAVCTHGNCTNDGLPGCHVSGELVSSPIAQSCNVIHTFHNNAYLYWSVVALQARLGIWQISDLGGCRQSG